MIETSKTHALAHYRGVIHRPPTSRPAATGSPRRYRSAVVHRADVRVVPSARDVGACVVKRDELVDLGGLWLESHGLPEKSETLGLSSRVRRAAPSIQMQSDESVVSRSGTAKTATLTMLWCRRSPPRRSRSSPSAGRGAWSRAAARAAAPPPSAASRAPRGTAARSTCRAKEARVASDAGEVCARWEARILKVVARDALMDDAHQLVRFAGGGARACVGRRAAVRAAKACEAARGGISQRGLRGNARACVGRRR